MGNAFTFSQGLSGIEETVFLTAFAREAMRMIL